MKNATSPAERGFSLVELMIALALGLFLTGVAITVVINNRQTFRLAENQARMQENARAAFEMMARDLRAAGGNPCGANQYINVLNNNGAVWWRNFAANSLRGFEASSAADLNTAGVPTGVGGVQPLANSDSLIALSGNVDETYIVASHNAAATPPQFTLTTNQHGFRAGEILMVCDSTQASIFVATNNPAGGNVVQHDAGGPAPGNSTAALGKTFENGALISRYSAALWFVGANGRGGNSLFRRTYDPARGGEVNDEIVDNVDGLQLQYVSRNWSTSPATLSTWNDASVFNPTDWNFKLSGVRIEAVRVELTLRSRDDVGISTTGQAAPLRTTVAETIYLRNREYRP
ncbi:MAG: PilW family protein [Azonexus sp.]